MVGLRTSSGVRVIHLVSSCPQACHCALATRSNGRALCASKPLTGCAKALAVRRARRRKRVQRIRRHTECAGCGCDVSSMLLHRRKHPGLRHVVLGAQHQQQSFPVQHPDHYCRVIAAQSRSASAGARRLDYCHARADHAVPAIPGRPQFFQSNQRRTYQVYQVHHYAHNRDRRAKHSVITHRVKSLSRILQDSWRNIETWPPWCTFAVSPCFYYKSPVRGGTPWCTR